MTKTQRSEQARRAALAYWSRLSPQERSIKNREVASHRQRRPVLDRLWEKVRITPTCWLFEGALDGCGYGSIFIGEAGKRTDKVHRVIFSEFYGSPVPDHQCVLHTCDTPSCVNPNHLWLGSQSDNATDREKKGRGNHAKGEKNGSSKLTLLKVLAIKELRRRGWSQQRIADRYKVSQVLVSAILRGKAWSWAKEGR